MRYALRVACAVLVAAAVLTMPGASGCHAPAPTPSAADAGQAAADPRPSPASPAVRLESRDGTWWLTAPSGESFFSLGVSVVSPGLTRAEYDPENPGYAAFRHYGDTAAWARAARDRLRDWGFTTVGGWGDFDAFAALPGPGPWFTPVLHLGSTAGAPWLDMWDPKVVARMDDVARRQIERLRDDPRVLGYYSDNELGWWNATLFKMTLQHPPTSGQRKRLVALLREHYGGDWGRLTEEFRVEGADGWKDLDRGRGTLFLQPGGHGAAVMRRFLGLVADRYYQLAHDIIRRYDRRALVLGDRYQSFYYPEVARAAGPWVDVVSTNLNASWNDGTFPRFYLDTLHRLTRRPIWVSELYMSAAENRSGNRNNHGIYPVVATQAERAAGLRRTLDGLLRLPYVVGAEWFQYADEPRHGRPDGENFNFGLVDIEDRPYDEVTSVFAALDTSVRSRPRDPRPDVTGGVPPAPPDPLRGVNPPVEPNVVLMDWDRERGFVPPASPEPMADLYVCWTPDAMYLGLYCLDFVEDEYYSDGRMSKDDRMHWTVTVNRAGSAPRTLRACLGAGREPILSDPGVRAWNLSGTGLKVRNVAILELPAAWFGKAKLASSDVAELSSELFTHCATYRVQWQSRLALGGR
jgi:hypothetical protein